MSSVESVKQGDRVVYSVGGTDYPAMAQGEASLGYHAGWKQASHHLNLVYLDKDGNAVKVTGAALATRAATFAHLAAHALMNVHARGQHRAPDGGEAALEKERARLLDEPRTTGWRPFVDTDEVDGLKADLAKTQEVNSILIEQLAQARSLIEKLQSEMPAASADIPEPSTEAGAALAGGAGISTLAGIESANHAAAAGMGVKPDEPSAEDLDAVAAEQQAAADTAEPAS